MSVDITAEIRRDYFRAKLLQYTRKAFKILPHLENPVVLDIGCGTGVVTMELARLTGGRVVGIDIDQLALDKLNQKIEQAKLSKQIKTVNCSMQDIQFKDNGFDIVWCEGAVFVIGFENGLKEWRRLIRPMGFMVWHARIIDLEKRTALIQASGYTLLDKFIVSKESWWDEYYGPLQSMIEGLRHKYQNDAGILAQLENEQKEVEEFKNNPEYHGSVFYIMQKTKD